MEFTERNESVSFGWTSIPTLVQRRGQTSPTTARKREEKVQEKRALTVLAFVNQPTEWKVLFGAKKWNVTSRRFFVVSLLIRFSHWTTPGPIFFRLRPLPDLLSRSPNFPLPVSLSRLSSSPDSTLFHALISLLFFSSFNFNLFSAFSSLSFEL